MDTASHPHPRRRSLRRPGRPAPLPLAALLAASLLPAAAVAATIAVTNCNDSGAGSLRAAIAGAASGDTIDLTGLGCSRIVLTGGQVVIPQADLTLVGRSRSALTLDGNRNDRVLWHRGSGRLRIEHVSVAYGQRANMGDPETGFDAGGCIRSEGNLELHRTRVHHCSVHTPGFLDSSSAGGGVSAAGNVLVAWSAVYSNSATDNGLGGGVAGGRVTLYRSQVYGNFAHRGGGVGAGEAGPERGLAATYSLVHGNRASTGGGGLYLWTGDLTLNKSTVSHNEVDNFAERSSLLGGGGLHVRGSGRRVIVDSTLSGNRAWTDSAAFFTGDATIYNSTIAFNVEDQVDEFPVGCTGALNATGLHLESTVAARNTCLTAPGYDIGASSSTPVTGADNLIENARRPVPADTISANPRLAPLAENGGPTRTHLPLSDSPVLERGGNPLDRAYDQRGPGFLRVRGAFPDIGAVER